MTNTGIKMASFRVDQEKWSAFIEYAREHNTTATGLILNYIDSCLSASTNGIMTKDRYHDKSIDQTNIINSLQKVQEKLVKDNQEKTDNITGLFELYETLQTEKGTLKATVQKLEERLKNVIDIMDVDRTSLDNRILENSERMDGLSQLIATTRTQVNECQIGAMTREQLMKMLVKKKIKFGVKATKADLIELALENGIIVI